MDPHDQGAISDALLKLVADKSLWLECRRNGLKNIHCFSWPEHCRAYLSHVEHCRALGGHLSSHCFDLPPPAPEPMSDSLRDLGDDLSLRFSLDDPTGALSANGELASAAILDDIRRRHETPHASSAKDHAPGPGRRHHVVVIAADCYDEDGRPAVSDLRRLLQAAMAAGSDAGRVAYVLATGSTVEETMEALRSCQVDAGAFDALVCGSGSELYYPSSRDAPEDAEYGSHVEYRWPAENVKSTVLQLARLDGAKEDDLAVDEAACRPRCHAYSVKVKDKVSFPHFLKLLHLFYLTNILNHC